MADDASTDGTAEIVAEYADRGVVRVGLAQRGGKERAQREALGHATGEIVAFTDVGTSMAPDGLSTIVRSFADPSVGCVSSSDRFLDEQGQPAGEGLYVRYEMLLRRLESDVNSLVGLSGSFFAARRRVLGEFSDRLPSDFCTLLGSIRAGLRGVADEDAHGYYADVANRGGRVRAQGAYRAARHGGVLRGARPPEPVAPPALRVAVRVAQVRALDGAVRDARRARHQRAARPGVGRSSASRSGSRRPSTSTRRWLEVFPRLDSNALGRTAHYFVVVNLSILVAWLRYLGGQRVVTWNPSAR